jgi:hypothetical protein
MKPIIAIAVLLLMSLPAAAVVRAKVTPEQLAAAINEADLPLVPYRTRAIQPGDIQAVRCMAPDEEPTEFQCRWRQRLKGGWVNRITWLAIDEHGWRVMDA